MKYLRLTAGLGLACLALATTAFAQAATEVQVPISDWLSNAGAWLTPMLAAVFMWLIRKLPAQIASVLLSLKVDQLLGRAIDYAINSVKGATAGKPLTFDVGNEVIAQALNYVLRHGPAAVIKWMGGEEMIREKIIARLDVAQGTALQ